MKLQWISPVWASSMVYDSVCLNTLNDESSSNLLCSAFCFIDMLIVWIVFRNFFALRQKQWNPRWLQYLPPQLTYKGKAYTTSLPITVIFQFAWGQKEVLVYEYIDWGWNLESSHYSYCAWPTGSVYSTVVHGLYIHLKEGTNRAKSVWCVQRACSWTFPNDSDACLWVCIRFEPFVFIGKQTSGIIRFGHEIKVNARSYTLNETPFYRHKLHYYVLNILT